MKPKLILILALALGLLASVPAQAQPVSTNSAESDLHSQLQTLISHVQTKVQGGKTSEADFADEFKTLDKLIADQKGAKTDEAALLLFMKAQLYLEVIKNTDKGANLVRQIKVDYPNTRYGTNADRILDGIAKQAAAQKIQDGLTVGSLFPDFSESDLDGKPLSVASRKGKVVLVDFWATWCPPCRAELPNVIKTYQKHHADGFEIIGVSLDSDRDKLNMFLKQEDGMTWPQFFDGQAWGNKLAAKYGVNAIPFALLIGPDGKIIGKDLRGDELEAAVAKALAAK
jgi:thiol-disulfide isomerase/thioredoxin